MTPPLRFLERQAEHRHLSEGEHDKFSLMSAHHNRGQHKPPNLSNSNTYDSPTTDTTEICRLTSSLLNRPESEEALNVLACPTEAHMRGRSQAVRAQHPQPRNLLTMKLTLDLPIERCGDETCSCCGADLLMQRSC